MRSPWLSSVSTERVVIPRVSGLRISDAARDHRATMYNTPPSKLFFLLSKLNSNLHPKLRSQGFSQTYYKGQHEKEILLGYPKVQLCDVPLN